MNAPEIKNPLGGNPKGIDHEKFMSTLYQSFHPTQPPKYPDDKKNSEYNARSKKAPNAKQTIDPLVVTDQMEVGVVGALRGDVVMIDLDDAREQAAWERVLSWAGLRVPILKTTHGKHYYFAADESVVNQNHTKVVIAAGIKCDIKVGAKRGFDCLKERGGTWREWENEGAALVAIPKWCKVVLTGKKAEEFGSLTGVSEGRRNNAVFEFTGHMLRAGVDSRDVLPYMMIANDCCLNPALDLEELEVACRTEGRGTGGISGAGGLRVYGGKSRGGFNGADNEELAKQVLETANFALIDGNLYEEKEHVMKMVVGKEIRAMDSVIIKKIRGTTVKLRAEIRPFMLEYMPQYNLEEEQYKVKDLVAFKNGVYNMEDGSFKGYEEYSGCHFFSKIPHEYREDWETVRVPAVLDGYLEDVTKGERDLRKMLYEVAGSCLHSRVQLRGAFILYGPPANGKSTFLNFLNYCIGSENCSSMKLQDLEDKFLLSGLIGKLANLGDDISDRYIKDTSILKSLLTGEKVSANVKYKDPVNFRSTATFVFTTNELPRMSDSTGGMMSRIKVVPFKGTVGKRDVRMEDKLRDQEAASIFLSKALNFYRQAVLRGDYTEAESARAEKEEYLILNEDSVQQYVRECTIESFIGRTVAGVYKDYKEFCEESELKPLAKVVFGRRINKGYGDKIQVSLTRDDYGKRVRKYDAFAVVAKATAPAEATVTGEQTPEHTPVQAPIARQAPEQAPIAGPIEMPTPAPVPSSAVPVQAPVQSPVQTPAPVPSPQPAPRPVGPNSGNQVRVQTVGSSLCSEIRSSLSTVPCNPLEAISPWPMPAPRPIGPQSGDQVVSQNTTASSSEEITSSLSTLPPPLPNGHRPPMVNMAGPLGEIKPDARYLRKVPSSDTNSYK